MTVYHYIGCIYRLSVPVRVLACLNTSLDKYLCSLLEICPGELRRFSEAHAVYEICAFILADTVNRKGIPCERCFTVPVFRFIGCSTG